MLLSGGNLVVHSGFSLTGGKSDEFEVIPEDVAPAAIMEVYPNAIRDKATIRIVPLADCRARPDPQRRFDAFCLTQALAFLLIS